MKDIYHLMHYCFDCKKEFSHSQASFDSMKLTCSGHLVIDLPTRKLSENSQKRVKQYYMLKNKYSYAF